MKKHLGLMAFMLGSIRCLGGCTAQAPAPSSETLAKTSAALECASGALSVSPSSPQLVGATVTFTASAATCGSPLYQFWILPPGGSWSIAQAYSGTATFAWDTTGLASGQYDVEVWMKDAASGVTTWDTYSESLFDLTAVPQPLCATPTLSASPAGPAAPNQPVTVTAGSSNCGSPQYQFWDYPPGGPWGVVQPYGSSATFNWDTTGGAAGTHHLEVWIKDASSSANWDTYAELAYDIHASCTNGTLSASPASPQLIGTSVTLTAGSSACGDPRYEFWVQPPGGAWTSVRAYGPSSSFTWDTTGLTAGTYNLVAWALDVLGAPNYDTTVAMTFDVVSTLPCDSGTLSASPSSPQLAGTMVTMTAGASTCRAPQYEFWVLAPGASWTLAQAYGSSATFAWDTTGLAPGTYEIEMWSKDALSSVASSETHSSVAFDVQ